MFNLKKKNAAFSTYDKIEQETTVQRENLRNSAAKLLFPGNFFILKFSICFMKEHIRLLHCILFLLIFVTLFDSKCVV